MIYCPLTLSSKYPGGCINTSCGWWISRKGCAIPVIAKETCKITEIIGKDKQKKDLKQGEWKCSYPEIEPNPMLMYGICSICGFEQSISNKLNYCPNCGAKMEVRDDKA